MLFFRISIALLFFFIKSTLAIPPLSEIFNEIASSTTEFVKSNTTSCALGVTTAVTTYGWWCSAKDNSNLVVALDTTRTDYDNICKSGKYCNESMSVKDRIHLTNVIVSGQKEATDIFKKTAAYHEKQLAELTTVQNNINLSVDRMKSIISRQETFTPGYYLERIRDDTRETKNVAYEISRNVNLINRTIAQIKANTSYTTQEIKNFISPNTKMTLAAINILKNQLIPPAYFGTPPPPYRP